MKREPHGKYWICNQCADEKGWVGPDGAVTGIMGTCGWCDGKKQLNNLLIPVCDYGQSGEKPLIWD